MESICKTEDSADSSTSESEDLNLDVQQSDGHYQAAPSAGAFPDTNRLKYWQQEINVNVKGSYYLVGRALYQVLYVERLLNSTSFVPWVKKTFGLTRSTAYEYLRAYRVVELLQRVAPTLPMPSTLSHFRVFSKCKLSADEVASVWRRVLESVPADCQRLTAKVVIASWKEAVAAEETTVRNCIMGSDTPCPEHAGFPTSDCSTGSPVAKRKKISSFCDTGSVPQYVTSEMLNGMVKECQNGSFCGPHSPTSLTDGDWPEIVYVNLVALFPDDCSFEDQGSFMEKVLRRFENGKVERGIFIVQLAFHSPSFIRLLCHPHCYLKPLAVSDNSRSRVHCAVTEAACEISSECSSKEYVLKQCAAIHIGKHAEKFVQVFSRCGIIPGVNSWSL